MKRRVLSFLLALTLCFSLLPVSATAEDAAVSPSPAAAAAAPAEVKKDEPAPASTPAPTPATTPAASVEDEEDGGEENDAVIMPVKPAGDGETGGIAPMNAGEENGLEVQAEGETPVAKVGDTEYATLDEILAEMEPVEITLLGNVSENITVYAATTINMAGFSITGNIEVYDCSLTLTGGTVTGKVKVDGGTFTIHAPAGAVAAINGGLNVISGSCSVSGAQVGVSGTLFFGGDSMTITGTTRAVSLTKEAEPAGKTFYGSATVGGSTAEKAVFADGTYTVGVEATKKLSNVQAGDSSEPVTKPVLTISPEATDIKAGAYAEFTVTYTGTDTLEAYIQKNGLDTYFVVTQKNNGNGTYKILVGTDAETPTGRYTLYVHETENTSVQAEAAINVTGLPRVAEVNGKTYTALSGALDNAKDGDTVKLLANIDGSFIINKTITLDLNGYSWNKTATIDPNSTLTLTGSGTVAEVTLGGKLDVQSGDVTVTKLNVTKTPTPKTELKSGKFKIIRINDGVGITASDLLADGYAFCLTDDPAVVRNGKKNTSLTDVTVLPHEHHIVDGECACGETCLHTNWKNGVCIDCDKTCTHENIDTSTCTCSTCGAQLAASLTADGNAAYYVGLADALIAAGKPGDGMRTVTLLKNAAVETVKDGGVMNTADATIVPGQGGSVLLDLNGYSITGGGTITIGANGNMGSLTVTGSGDVNTTIRMSDGRLSLEAFSGKITTLEMDGVGGKVAPLSCGTFGTITADTAVTAGELLASGYVFKNADGYVSQTTPADDLTEVTVVKCDHNDYTSGTCRYCGEEIEAKLTLGADTVLYTSLKDAIAAAQTEENTGCTVTLLKDMSGSNMLVNAGRFTLDLGGKRLYGDYGTLLMLSLGSDVTVTNGTLDAANAYAVSVVGSASLRLTGTVKVSGVSWESTGTLKIEPGAVFQIQRSDGNQHKVRLSAERADLGVFYTEGIAFKEYKADGTTGDFVVLDRTAQYYSAGDLVAVEHWSHPYRDGVCLDCGKPCPGHDNFDSSGFCSTCAQYARVARIDREYYKTLPEAIAAAQKQDGCTITFLCSISLPDGEGLTIDRGTFTLDLNGKFIIKGDVHTALTFTGDAAVTLKNGTLMTDNSSRVDILLSDGANLTIEDMTVVGWIVLGSEMNDNAKLTLVSGSITVIDNQKGVAWKDILAPDKRLRHPHSTEPITLSVISADKQLHSVDIERCDPHGEYIVDTANARATCEYCGTACPHINTDLDGKCEKCGLKMAWIISFTDIYGNINVCYRATDAEMLASVAEFTAEGDTNILAMMEDSKRLNAPLTIRDGTFTLDLSGKSIVGGMDALLLTGSANVTLTNGGLSALTSGAFGIRVQDGASLTVVDSVTVDGALVVKETAGTVLLRGGKFQQIQTENRPGNLAGLLAPGYRYELVTEDGTATPQSYTAMQGAADVEANGYIAAAACDPHKFDTNLVCEYCNIGCRGDHTYDDSGKCTICGYTCPHDAVTETGNTAVCGTCKANMAVKVTNGETVVYLAKTMEVRYTSLGYRQENDVTMREAFNSTADNGIVTLLADDLDAWADVSGKTVTLDFNGHWLSENGIDFGSTGPTTVILTGSGGTITPEGVGPSIGAFWLRDGALMKTNGFTGTIGRLTVSGASARAKLSSGTYGTIRYTSGSTGEVKTSTVGGWLAEGYAFRYVESGEYVPYDTTLTSAEVPDAAMYSLDNVTVVKCDHNGTSGFDMNSLKCPYCGAPAVAQTALTGVEGNPWRNFADLQTALDAQRDGSSTLRLLADVSGEYTINGATCTGIDLNGYSINGTVYVTAGGEDTTFSNSKSTGTVGTVVASAGAKLAGSGAPAVIGTLTLADGATWANILYVPAQYGYRVYTNYPDMRAYKWYGANENIGTELHNVTIERLPITSNTLTLKANGSNVYSSVERGTTVQLCAYCNTSGADVAFYVGEHEGNGYNYAQMSGGKVEYKKIGTTWYYVAEYTFSERGEYDIYFTAAKDGYSVSSGNKTLTVTKASIPADAITAPIINTLTYNGQPQELVTPGVLDAKYGTIQYSLSRSAGSFSTEIPTKTDAGTYNVYYKVLGNDDYKDGNRTYTLTVTIGPKTLYLVNAALAEKIYDGTADAVVTRAEFYGLVDGDTLTLGTDYTATGEFIDSNAGDGKTAGVTVKLTGNVKNYTLRSGDSSTLVMSRCTIQKATAPAATPGELYIYNDLAKTYEVELPALPALESPKTYGVNISYNSPSSDLSTSYNYGGIKFENSKLSLPILKNPTNIEGRIGTVQMTVVTDNYEDFKLEINVFAKNRITPGINVLSASDITYGQPLSESTLSFAVNGAYDPTTGAAVEGTLRWKDGSIVPGINADDNWYDYEFIPADEYDGKYAIATGRTSVKVNPAALTDVSVSQNGTLTYNGKPQTAKVNAAATAVNGQKVEFTYSAAENGTYSGAVPAFTDAGTYTVYYKANSTGHTEAAGSFTVTIDPLPISLLSISKISKTYDGSASAELLPSMLTFVSKAAKRSDITLPDTALTISDARFTMLQADESYADSPEAGDGKSLSFTMTLTSGNYVFERKPESRTDECDIATDAKDKFTITKAAAPAAENGALTITNGLHKTYSFDLSTLLPSLTAPGEYGEIAYGKPVADLGVGSFVTLVNSKTGALTLEVVDRSSTDEGQFGTITVAVTTANYADITLTINVSAVNKTVPVPDGEVSASSITYGQTLNDSTITGKMKDPATGAEVTGTFAWKNGAVKPIAGVYRAELIFMPDAPEYAAVTGIASVKVNRKDITGAVITLKSDSVVYDGTEKSPELESVVLDGVTLVNGQDYDYVYVYAHGTDVGQYGLTVVGYNNYEGEATAYFSITPRTVTAPTVTVSGAPFVYTGSAIAPDVTVTDDLGHVIDPKEYSVSYKDNTNAGTATITVTDNDGGNYTVSGGTTFEIDKAMQTVAAGNVSGVYGETDKAVAVTAAIGDVTFVSSDESIVTVDAAGALAFHKSGTAEITVRAAGDANHYGAQTKVTVTVAKAPVTIKAHDKAIYRGLAAPSLADPKAGMDYTVTGLLGSDTLSGITVRLAYAQTPNTARVGTTEIVLTVTGEDARYAVTAENGTLTVSNRSFDTIVEPSENGDITSDAGKSTAEGGDQTWRITPKPGYATADVIVDGKHVGPVNEWTFKNVREKHTIEAVFMPIAGNPQNGVNVGN